jgi:drug/metabolite transporter (DMT)-like permease
VSKPKAAYIYIVLTILLWSSTPAVAKLGLDELSNFQLLFYTGIVGAISLLVVNFFQGKLSLLNTYTKEDYLKMFGMGFLGIFLYYVFFYQSFVLAPPGQVNVVNYLWPVFIIILSIPILKERYNFQTILAILVSFVGALVVFTRGDITSFSNEYTGGYLLAAIGALCYGLFSVLGKKLEYDKFSSMFVYYIAAVILIIPISIMVSGFALPTSIPTIIAILALGGVINPIAFVFWFKALKLGNTHNMANMIYAVPFLAMIWTYFLNKEPFSLAAIIGLVLIVGGIFIQLRNKLEAKTVS